MAITKAVVVGVVGVLESGVLEVRFDTVVTDDDGSELTRRFARRTYEPSSDLTTAPVGRIRQIATVVWTAAVVTAWANRPKPTL